MHKINPTTNSKCKASDFRLYLFDVGNMNEDSIHEYYDGHPYFSLFIIRIICIITFIWITTRNHTFWDVINMNDYKINNVFDWEIYFNRITPCPNICSHTLFFNFENEWKVKNGFVLVLLKDKNGICQVNIFCSSTNSLEILLYGIVYLQNASPCIDYSALESNNCHTIQ